MNPVSSVLKENPTGSRLEIGLEKYSGSVVKVTTSGTANSKMACDFAESGDGAKTTAQFTPIWAAFRVWVPFPEKLPETVLAEQSPAPVAINWRVVGTKVSVGAEG